MQKAFFEIFRDTDYQLHLGVSENNAFDAHYHSNIEIVYLLEGEMEITVGEETRLLTAGQLAVADSYDVHCYRTPERSLSYVMIIPIELVGSFSRLSEGKTFSAPFLTDPGKTAPIREAISGIERLEKANPLAVKGYLYVILGLLAEALPLVPCARSAGTIGPIRDILLYLDRNFQNPVQMTDLARQFGYNKDYLSRIFNSTIGCGFKHYLNLLRARHAANRLQNSNDPVSDIAEYAGFTSQRTFNRVFREIYGCTPVEYKRAVR
ncbi:MAG: AraC family transcriptional regulator [Candidatus Howiella sp.]|jgi:AraC-like DNA-binding protein